MISIEKPGVLVFLLLLIPLLVFDIYRYAKISKCLFFSFGKKNIKSIKRLKTSLIFQSLFKIMGLAMVIFAFSGISWGKETVTVQKSSGSVYFVFDISYSMTAKDGPEKISRLEACKIYALELLHRMNGIPAGIVLAKGDGIVAVPLTEDYFALEMMIENLSPNLMTAAGSSLGKGLDAAVAAFPEYSSSMGEVWIFTDGDETDSQLLPSLCQAGGKGIGVTVVGFGKTEGIDVTAGDGKTKVKTFLNENHLIQITQEASKKFLGNENKKNTISEKIRYVNSSQKGSAHSLLEHLTDEKAVYQTFESKNISRYGLFLLLAVVFFIASCFASEFNLDFFDFKSSGKKSFSFMIVFAAFLLCSCSGEKSVVLSGCLSWIQKDYNGATGDFLRAYSSALDEQDKTVCDYAAYNLASTYIFQEEYEAAMFRLEQVSEDADSRLRSASFYNQGIIAEKKGNYSLARDFYKKAIILDSSNINARINLEFTKQHVETGKSSRTEAEMSKVNIDKKETALSNQIFTLIQEEETDRWKKLQSGKQETTALDY